MLQSYQMYNNLGCCVRVLRPTNSYGHTETGLDLKSNQKDWRSPELNPRPLIYKAIGLTTTLRRLQINRGTYSAFCKP